MGGAVLCGTASGGAVTSLVTATARGAPRLGRLTPLASCRDDVDQSAGRGRSKEKAKAGMDGLAAPGGFSKPPCGWKEGGGFYLRGKKATGLI